MQRGTISRKRFLDCAAVLSVAVAMLLVCCAASGDVTPQAAERFTHLLGVNLANGIDFEQLAKRFGASPVVKTGNAENYDARVCYRSADDKAVVEFAQGEVNYQFVVRDVMDKDARCPVSKAIAASQLNVAELKLGMSQAAFEKLLGKPTRSVADRLTYQFEYTHTLSDAEIAKLMEKARKEGYDSDKPADLRNWDVNIFIQAGFKGGRLGSLLVDRVETN